MLPAFRLISRNIIKPQINRHLSVTGIRKMPFTKHEVVPDVVSVAPSGILKIDYVSGGDYTTFHIYIQQIELIYHHHSECQPWKCIDSDSSERSTNSSMECRCG